MAPMTIAGGFPCLMNFITPMVAVGDLGAALDHRLLRAQRIEAVLSLAPLSLDGVIAHHLLLEVADRVPLPGDVIAASMAFIDRHVAGGRRVLVHCEQGISRSPSLAVCYLHEARGMTLEEALAHVKSVRPIAEPHPELMGSIRDYYHRRSQPDAG